MTDSGVLCVPCNRALAETTCLRAHRDSLIADKEANALARVLADQLAERRYRFRLRASWAFGVVGWVAFALSLALR